MIDWVLQIHLHSNITLRLVVKCKNEGAAC